MTDFKAVRSGETEKAKVFSVGDRHEVHVSHVYFRHESGLSVIEVSGNAVGSSHVESRRWTIGATDGPRPVPDTLEQLQVKLDALRETVAHETGWKEENHQNVEKLQ